VKKTLLQYANNRLQGFGLKFSDCAAGWDFI